MFIFFSSHHNLDYCRDYIGSGSVYITPDSGGECGVPYETYFPMPVAGKDKPWYSIEQGPVHFTVISSEHNYKEHSEQVLNTKTKITDHVWDVCVFSSLWIRRWVMVCYSS